MNRPGGMMDSLATVNSMVRTGLALAVAGVVGFTGWMGYTIYNDGGKEISDLRAKMQTQEVTIANQQQELADQKREIGVLQVENERLDTALRLLKVDQRIARLTVLDQTTDPNDENQVLISRVEFAEVDRDGQELDKPKVFDIKGDEVFVHSWVVKFDDEYVENADLHRATSLVLFQRIFGDRQTPNSGFPLDKVGDRPRAYGSGEMSDFEKKIWGDFWEIANDPERATSMGIRAIHGEAPSMKVKKGKTYRLKLRASGGVWFQPGENAPVTKPTT